MEGPDLATLVGASAANHGCIHAVKPEQVGQHRDTVAAGLHLLLPQRALERASQAHHFARLEQQRGACTFRHTQPVGGRDHHARHIARHR